MHIRWSKVVEEREAEKTRNLAPRIRMVLTPVGVYLEFSTGPS